MSTRWILKNLSFKRRSLLTSSSSYISTNPMELYTQPFLFPTKILGCQETYSGGLRAFHDPKDQIHDNKSSLVEKQLDPFSLVADELSIVANRLRSMVVSENPKLASAAEYFFKEGVEGKRFRPTVLLLMGSALNIPNSNPDAMNTVSSEELRTRQQYIAIITEMVHVASLLHDDVLDDAETRRGIGSLNCSMGPKMVDHGLATCIEKFMPHRIMTAHCLMGHRW